MSEVAEIFEMFMVILFGISWPLNIIKAVRIKTAKGTSLWFLICIILGYIFGIVSKIINNNITYVLIFYVINLVMVLATVLVYFRNKKLDQLKEKNN